MEGKYPNRLAECMRKAGLSRSELASLAQISKQQVHYLCQGHRNMTVQWAQRLAPHLHVSWQEVIEAEREHTAEEREILHAFQTVDPQGQEILLRLARSLLRDPQCLIRPTVR